MFHSVKCKFHDRHEMSPWQMLGELATVGFQQKIADHPMPTTSGQGIPSRHCQCSMGTNPATRGMLSKIPMSCHMQFESGTYYLPGIWRNQTRKLRTNNLSTTEVQGLFFRKINGYIFLDGNVYIYAGQGFVRPIVQYCTPNRVRTQLPCTFRITIQ